MFKFLMVTVMFATSWAAADQRPNIVVFFTDDLDFDETPPGLYDVERFPCHTGMKKLGYYDDEYPKFDKPEGDYFENPTMLMPNLQQLAEDGMVLERFYITSPVCTPSRYSMLTGRLATRSPGFLNQFPAGGPANLGWNASVSPSENTLSKVLQKNGYFTGMVGKWHNGHGANAYNAELKALNGDDPGVNEKVKEAQRIECRTMEKEQGFDFAASVQIGNVGALKAPPKFRRENLEWVTQGALDFLDQAAESEKPFYLYMSLPMPHRQFYDPQKNNPNAGYWFDHDPRATPGGYLDEIPGCMPPRDDVVRRCKEAGIPLVNSMGTYIDDSLGAVLKKIEELGVSEDTIVIVTADHQSRGKNTVGESARVPFVIKWPGQVIAGSRADGIASNVDLVTTLLDISGSKDIGDVGLDGESFLPMLKGESETARDSLYLEIMFTRAIVTDRYKYIACRPSKEVEELMAKDAIQAMEQQRRRKVAWDGRANNKGKAGNGVIMDSDREFPGYFDRDQLYDLKEDPFEQYNLADDPAHAETLAQMRGLLSSYLADLPHTFGEF